MRRLKEVFSDEIQQKALFSPASNMAYDQVFRLLNAAGVQQITWSADFNAKYQEWKRNEIRH